MKFHIFYLVHQLQLLLALTFVPLSNLFGYYLDIFIWEEFIYGHLRIVLSFPILTIAPLISESLLGNPPVTMTILQKCLGTVSS